MAGTRDFVDEVRLHVHAGDGGNGVASFRREKYRPKGGPDGGNGGDGGSVILRVTPGVSTLAEIAHHPHQKAERGAHGQGSDRHGAASGDRAVPVPAGTIVRDAEGEILADLTEEGAEFVAARGGKGGRGNASIATARRRAPGFAERGEAGEERWLHLELRLLADVGLVGLPNAGKSSLIGKLSAARPKVAAYPFTTLTPNLGVAEAGGDRFVVADVPGLVEGAAQGRGLGLAFLRHLSRCRVLCFVVDLSEESPAETLRVLRAEIAAYDAALAARTSIVAGNKIDLPGARERIAEAADAAGAPFFPVSALTGDGAEELATALASAVEQERSAKPVDEAPVLIRIRPESEAVEVLRENGAYRVLSPRAERLIARYDLNNPDAVRYVQERLVSLGVEDALERAGAREGDEVLIGEQAFDFTPEHSA
ncbi:MAG: GTPase ObgE [Actinomycetota bacterium]